METDRMTYPVIAWTLAHNGAPLYVSDLPGDGGVDWGFTSKANGTEYARKTYRQSVATFKSAVATFCGTPTHNGAPRFVLSGSGSRLF